MTLAFELGQGLAYRSTAHPESCGQLRLFEVRARLELTGDDHLAKQCHDQLAKRGLHLPWQDDAFKDHDRPPCG